MGRPAILKVDIVADAKGVKAGAAEAESRLGKLGERVGKVGLAVGAGMAAAGVAVGAFAVSAVQAASDVQQNYGALDSVFGKSADQVRAWAESAANSVGLAKAEYSGLAAQVGAQLTGMGLSQQKASGTTRDLIKMGADLSATFGGSVSDAVEAVGSLLRGEADPIERYGVSIKASDVAARLAAQGQSKLTGAALKQAQAQATLALLQDKTRNSVGAFGRETDTLAHKQQVLAAQFDNVKAKVGAALLPVITTLVGYINSTLLPVVSRLGSQLVTFLGPALSAIGQLFAGLGGKAGAFERIGATFHDQVIPAARQLFGVFRANVLPILSSVATYVGTVLVPAFAAVAGFVVGRLVPAIARALVPVLQGLRTYIGKVTEAVQHNRPQLEAIGRVLATVAAFIAEKVLPIVGKLAGFLLGTFGTAIATAVNVVGTLVKAVTSVVDALKSAWDWLSKVGSKLSHLPHPPSWLHFGGVELAGPLAGPLGGASYAVPELGSWATASMATADLLGGGLFDSGGGRGLVVVDRRSFPTTVQVDGALDGPSVARQLAELLDDHAVRLGRLTAYSPAR